MTRAFLALVLGLALVAGCGGDDNDGGGGGGDAMSREDFVSEANKICREGEEKINAKAQEVQEKIQDAGSSAEEQQKAVADVLEETAKEYDPYLERLGDLKPPEDLQADWDKFLAGVNDAFELIPDLADATRDGDRDKLSELTTRFSQIAGDTRPFAQKYKLDDCLPDNTTS
jgi:hypothetical protein